MTRAPERVTLYSLSNLSSGPVCFLLYMTGITNFNVQWLTMEFLSGTVRAYTGLIRFNYWVLDSAEGEDYGLLIVGMYTIQQIRTVRHIGKNRSNSTERSIARNLSIYRSLTA